MIVSHYFCLIFESYCAPIFGIFILFSYINVCIELCGESHLRATVYRFTLDWLKDCFILVHTYVFILLHFVSYVKY